jgi:dihydrofolate reductase
MGNVILGIAMSLDGYINDASGSVNPLYENFQALVDSPPFQEAMRDTGAVVMGRRSYEMANGDFTGYEFQVPIFVVTHHAPDVIAKGTNDQLSFTFVTEGVESAIAQAKAASGDRNVMIIGTASIGMQCLNAGLVDIVQVDVVSVLLGAGLRMFDSLAAPLELEQTRVLELGDRTTIDYRVVK